MLIRKWEKKDNPQIAFLEGLCFEFPWSEEMIYETQSHPLFLGIVGEETEKVICYAGAVYCMEDADIALVATSPEFRRKGYAESVINRLIDELFKKGVRNIYLEVRITNDGAKSLYTKLGFIPVGIRKNYYENAEDAIVMKKVLLD